MKEVTSPVLKNKKFMIKEILVEQKGEPQKEEIFLTQEYMRKYMDVSDMNILLHLGTQILNLDYLKNPLSSPISLSKEIRRMEILIPLIKVNLAPLGMKRSIKILKIEN